MGFAERILTSPTPTKIIIASDLVGLLLMVIGFSTFYWLKLDNVGRQGLWYYCYETGIYECCATINSHTDTTGISIPAFIHATRAFETVGLLLAIIANFILFATIAKPSLVENRAFRIILKGSHIFAGIDILIGIIIYGADYNNHTFTSSYNLHVSFGLCVVASFNYILSGLILTFSDSGDEE